MSKHVGFDPAAVEDEDIKKILSGMNSVVDGIGSLGRIAALRTGRAGRRTVFSHAMRDWQFTPPTRLLAFY